MQLKRCGLLAFALMVLVGLSGCVSNAPKESESVVFRKSESWGPCLVGYVCEQDTILYSSGRLVRTGQTNSTTTLSKEGLESFFSQVRSTGIMEKNCSTEIVVDYWAEYQISLDGIEKSISYPGCSSEIEKIEAKLPPAPAKQGGA